ncbi:S41 family peptidase [Niastella sp. OAS944]|uniref:S41 family peptidase n=1 Tax=Niastella sp. OAS944 TaxID=2664089 RepID=UPI003478520E|nr:hypothetical protein [Chitinophagaceae bacterium OAS944]
MLRLAFFVCLFILIGVVGFSQGSADTLQILTAEQYRQDFVCLRQAFERTYPSLNRFTDKASVEKMFDSCNATINQQTNRTSFYSTIKYVLSALGDGHLSSKAPPSLRNVFEAQTYFPLSLIFLHQGAYNFCDHPLIPKGAQIISINGVAIQLIRERLYPYLVSDGAVKTSKNWMLNSTFWFYYYLVFGEQQAFAVCFKLPGGSFQTASLNAEQRKNFLCSPYEFLQTANLLDLSYPEKNVAVLTIKTFSRQVLTNASKDFDAFLDSSFRTIKQKGINRLIIDLRGNGGGADVYGAHLYSFLTSKPFRYYQELETKGKKLTSADHPNLALLKPTDTHYNGEVLFLINGLTFSSAAEFCSIAKSNNRGKFIGEETGGGYYGNTSGGFIDIVLPNTSITVSIPTTKYVMAVRKIKEKNRGIIPDYVVVPTINNILENKDVQMEHAIRLTAAKADFVK